MRGRKALVAEIGAVRLGVVWIERIHSEFSVEWIDKDVVLYVDAIDAVGDEVAVAITGVALDELAQAVAAARAALLEQVMPEDFSCDTVIDLGFDHE